MLRPADFAGFVPTRDGFAPLDREFALAEVSATIPMILLAGPSDVNRVFSPCDPYERGFRRDDWQGRISLSRGLCDADRSNEEYKDTREDKQVAFEHRLAS